MENSCFYAVLAAIYGRCRLGGNVPSVASKAYVDTQITEKAETKVDTVPGTVQTLNGDYTVAGSMVVTGSFTVTGAFKVPTPPLPNPDAE